MLLLLLALLSGAPLLHKCVPPALRLSEGECVHEAAVHVADHLALELSAAGLYAQVAPPQLDDLAAAAAAAAGSGATAGLNAKG
jgi:hypothetical protein